VDDDVTQELLREQERRARDERRRAQEAEEEAETRTHERRADKHTYLESKLAEREKSEDG
jgi:hypothetical protein